MRYIRAAVRMFMFFAATLGIYSIWLAGSLFIPNRTFWRQIVFGIWARNFMAVSGMKIEITGTPPRPPFLLVANHLSYVDVAALRNVLDTVFVAKSDVEDWFLAGRIIRDMGTVFIDRKNRRDIPRVADEIIRKLEDGEGVTVFPEGTTTRGEEVLPFNSSLLEFAAAGDLPVSFASISYRTPDGEPSASEAVCWWDDKTFIEHLRQLFALKEFTAIINFGEKPVKRSDRKELAHELREKIREKFIPVL